MIDINELAVEVGKMLDRRMQEKKRIVNGAFAIEPSTLEQELIKATEVQRRFGNFVQCNPALSVLMMVDDSLVQVVLSMVVYGFHVGREYGKSELVQETLKGMEGGE